jgi:hypothetical protein
MMKIVKLDSVTDISQLVASMEMDTYYELPQNYRYKWIRFHGHSGLYSWAMEYNYQVSGCVGYIFPLSGNMVTQFKTKSGAKRNFLRRYEKYFNECLIGS